MFPLPMFFEVWDYSNPRLKEKLKNKKILLEMYKNEVKVIANPGLA